MNMLQQLHTVRTESKTCGDGDETINANTGSPKAFLVLYIHVYKCSTVYFTQTFQLFPPQIKSYTISLITLSLLLNTAGMMFVSCLCIMG